MGLSKSISPYSKTCYKIVHTDGQLFVLNGTECLLKQNIHQSRHRAQFNECHRWNSRWFSNMCSSDLRRKSVGDRTFCICLLLIASKISATFTTQNAINLLRRLTISRLQFWSCVNPWAEFGLNPSSFESCTLTLFILRNSVTMLCFVAKSFYTWMMGHKFRIDARYPNQNHFSAKPKFLRAHSIGPADWFGRFLAAH